MDDIWAWVNDLKRTLYADGQEALADKIENFSTLASDKDGKAVENIYPELLAYARSTENAWLEVFIRHWRLQAYVNSAADPRPLVPEALDLLAFTYKEEASNCPQNTCVVDDLSDIYAAIDAKGFAQARLDMIDEAMDGLSTNVGCYICMSFSKYGALLDLNQPDKAFAHMEDAKSKSNLLTEVTGGSFWYDTYFHQSLAPTFVRGHVTAGEADIALELAEKCTPTAAYNKCEVDFLKAEAHFLKADYDQAKQSLKQGLTYADDDIHIQQLVGIIPDFAAKDLLDKDFGTRLLSIAQNAQSRGRAAEAFNAARLAHNLVNDDKATKTALDIMNDVKDNLADPERAQGEIDGLRAS